MDKNNFQKLEEMELEKASFDDVGVQNNIGSSMSLIRFITDIVELYIPNILETMLSSFNQNSQNKK